MLESLAKVIEITEERAREREERMCCMELEMEERMREREERRYADVCNDYWCTAADVW